MAAFRIEDVIMWREVPALARNQAGETVSPIANLAVPGSTENVDGGIGRDFGRRRTLGEGDLNGLRVAASKCVIPSSCMATNIEISFHRYGPASTSFRGGSWAATARYGCARLRCCARRIASRLEVPAALTNAHNFLRRGARRRANGLGSVIPLWISKVTQQIRTTLECRTDASVASTARRPDRDSWRNARCRSILARDANDSACRCGRRVRTLPSEIASMGLFNYFMMY